MLLDIFEDIGYKINAIDKVNRTTKAGVSRSELLKMCDQERNSMDYVDVILEV